MNDLNTLIKKLIEEKGGDPSDYHLLMDKIAFHETGGTLDPKQVQIGGGTGRGLFQFETGKHRGAITAAKRTKQYLEENKIKIPNWLKNATKNDSLDADKLNSDQQKMLFLGNMRKHPKADLAKVIDGTEPIHDFWANYHWAGNDKDRYKRIQSFNNHMKEFKLIPIQKKNNFDMIGPLTEENAFKPINNQFSLGGNQSFTNEKSLNSFNGGGTHEQNPLGGIPIGNNSSVEANETSFNIKGNKFIFSDRISTDGKFEKFTKTNNSFPDGGAIDPPNKIDVSKIKSQAFNWYLNPITNKRLKSNLEFLNKDPNKSEKMISKATSNINKVNINQTGKDMGVIKGEFNSSNPRNIDLHKGATEQSLAHELSHATLGIDDTLTKFITKKYGSPLTNKRQQLIDSKQLIQNKDYSFSNPEGNQVGFNDQLKMMFPDKTSFSIENELNYMRHINQNGELYPRFQEMRSFLNVKPGDIIDDSHIEKLMNNKKTSELFKYYKPEVIKEILNTVADNNSTNNYNNIA